MKLSQFFRSARGALVAVPVAMALLGGASYAIAQTTSTTLPDPPKSAKAITISGTPAFGNDSMSFKDQPVEINSTLSRDADPAVPPQLIIDIVFVKFAGDAVTSKVKYISDNQFHLLKLLAPAHSIEVTFSAPEAKKDATGNVKDPTTLTAAEATQVLAEAPSFKAVFNLTFDSNGVITSATGAVSENTYAAN